MTGPIRPQYHFRKDGGRTLIWDVRAMIARVEAANLPIIDVALSDIPEIDEPYWFNTPPNCRAILEHAQLIEAADLAYPILLFPDGKLFDGMHRVLKAVGLGHDTIKARRITDLPPPDHIDKKPDELPYE